jgi:hypothetical protein
VTFLTRLTRTFSVTSPTLTPPGALGKLEGDCGIGYISQVMGMVSVQVWDATGNKRQEVEMPDDAPVNRLIAVLLQRMNFPQYAPDGQPLSYKLHHRASGKQLLDGQTLGEVGVKAGDILRLQPEITAG